MGHSQLKNKALKVAEVRAEYDALGPEFTLLRDMLLARQAAGMSQGEVAEKMGTKPPAVARLESALGSGKHSPSIATLRKYADAVGCSLEIRLVCGKTASKTRAD
jgi:transcriptional regulator with XRE-family HTH domain